MAVDQQDLGEFADAEPDDDERQIGQRRQRAVELDRRIEDAPGVAVHAHQDADRNGGGAGQEEGREHPRQAGHGVLGQGRVGHALGHGRHELAVHRLRRWQEQRLDPAGIGGQNHSASSAMLVSRLMWPL